jgi:ribonuclease HI
MGKYYAVQRGHSTGVFSTWSEAQAATKGYAGAVHKSFSSASEASAFAKSTGGYSSSRGGERGARDYSSNSYSSGSSLSGDRSSEDHSSSSSDMVYTDGSSRGNGRAGASAGYGVYYGPGDSRNYAGKLDGERQTNQRAELKAIDHALSNAQVSGRDVHIYTDSEYSKNAVTTWGDKWDRNGYRNAKGEPVVNRDLIESVRDRINDLQSRGAIVEIEHLRGHSGNAGNEAADRLANEGAMK